jgi:CheY-like chemotaxis protein
LRPIGCGDKKRSNQVGSALSASPDANILLDARMPGIDGFETARLIRHEENALAQALGEHFHGIAR